jgi:hypothetical protein
VKAVVEIDKGIHLPELAAKFLSSYKIAGGLNEYREHLERLALQAKLYPALSQFACKQIKFIGVESQNTRGWRSRGGHTDT